MELNNFIESNCLNKEEEIIKKHINKIDSFTKTNHGEEIVINTLSAYTSLSKKINSNFAIIGALETLGWAAEGTENIENVKKAAECLLEESITGILEKYKLDISDEIFTRISEIIFAKYNPANVKNYLLWLNSEIISKLLGIANEFSKYENVKLKKNIFTILSLDSEKLSMFNSCASGIEKRRFSTDKKIELYCMLKDIVNSGEEKYAKIFVSEGIKRLKEEVEKDLGLKINNSIPSIRYGLLLTKARRNDPNVDFLIRKCLENENVKKWIYSDEITKAMIKKMKECGFNTDLYIASGKKISEARSNGIFSEEWSECLKNIVIELVGKRNQMLPKVSIFNLSPKVIFKNIKDSFLKAIKKSKSDANILLEKLDKMITESYSKRKITRPVSKILNEIRGLKKVIEYGGTLNFRGAKVTAKVWKRTIPNDLYDSDVLRCCIHLPSGVYRYEIPLFMMDPATTIIYYHIQGIDEPIAAATFYAGLSENQPTLYMEGWVGGGLAYSALGNDKMKEFVLESMLKFAKMVGAKKLLVYEDEDYGRSVEFCNFLKKRYKMEEVYFESIDSEDSVLAAYSKGEKHHYTDAFYNKPIKDKIRTFAFEIK